MPSTMSAAIPPKAAMPAPPTCTSAIHSETAATTAYGSYGI